MGLDDSRGGLRFRSGVSKPFGQGEVKPAVVRRQSEDFRVVARAWDAFVGSALDASRASLKEDDTTPAGMSS